MCRGQFPTAIVVTATRARQKSSSAPGPDRIAGLQPTAAFTFALAVL